MIFLRNYLILFVLTYLVLFITKMLFFTYLRGYFTDYTFMQQLYALLWGYKFDFAISGIFAFLVSLFDFNRRVLSVVGSSVLVSIYLFQISDILYYYDSARHVGYEVLDSVNDASGLIDTALSQHSALSVFTLISSLLSLWFFYKILNRYILELTWSRYTVISKLFLLLLTVFFIRGMFNHIPLNPWQSNQIGDSKLASIALNGTYNMLTAVMADRAHLKPIKLPDIKDKNISSLYSGYTPIKAELNRPNIVFFFLESWSMVNISKKNTPFFYEMMQKSIRPKAMIANGHRTTEGIFAVLSSFENPLGKSVAKNQLQDFEYESVIELLNADGYESSFFQGTAKETSGTGSLAQKLGFKNSYGKSDITDVRYGYNSWGVYDQDLYRFVQERVKESKKPFVIGINGATTHDSTLPKGTKLLKLSTDKKHNALLNTFHSSDEALGEFVKEIEQRYPNTLFVFFADHCGHVESSSYENYLIPFALYHKDLKAKSYDVILSQRDISPSVVDLIYGDYRSHLPNASGKSLFSDKNFFAEYFQNGMIGWIYKDDGIEIDISSGKYSCFKLENLKQHYVTCKELHKKLYNDALSFHTISQNLLFKGESKKFSVYN